MKIQVLEGALLEQPVEVVVNSYNRNCLIKRLFIWPVLIASEAQLTI